MFPNKLKSVYYFIYQFIIEISLLFWKIQREVMSHGLLEVWALHGAIFSCANILKIEYTLINRVQYLK